MWEVPVGSSPHSQSEQGKGSPNLCSSPSLEEEEGEEQGSRRGARQAPTSGGPRKGVQELYSLVKFGF